MSRIEVAVGLIQKTDGKVLVGQRTVRDRYFGKWEFPGGKLEADESVEQALIRELKEELGIAVRETERLMILEHDYPDRLVRLHVLRVNGFSGAVNARENQALRWLDPRNLDELDFLDGNRPIIERLCG